MHAAAGLLADLLGLQIRAPPLLHQSPHQHVRHELHGRGTTTVSGRIASQAQRSSRRRGRHGGGGCGRRGGHRGGGHCHRWGGQALDTGRQVNAVGHREADEAEVRVVVRGRGEEAGARTTGRGGGQGAGRCQRSWGRRGVLQPGEPHLADVALRYRFAALPAEGVAAVGGDGTAQDIAAEGAQERVVVLHRGTGHS